MAVITATFDPPKYRTARIDVSFTTSEKVRSLHATDFSFRKVDSGKHELYDFELALGDGESALKKTLYIYIPLKRQGVFELTLESNIVKSLGGLDATIYSAGPLTIPYNTQIPRVSDMWQPTTLSSGIWDVYVDWDIAVTGFSKADVWSFGAKLSKPQIYRWTGSTAPDFDSKRDRASTTPADAYKNPAGLRNTANLVKTVGNWKQINQDGNTVEARYFLMRYVNPSTIFGTTNIVVTQGAVFGPTGEGQSVAGASVGQRRSKEIRLRVG